MILGIDDPLFFFFSSSHTCRQVLYNFSSCAKSAWILTASQRNERMKNEEGTATGRWCQRLAVFPPAVSLLCLPPLLACFPSCLPFIYPSISLPFLSPCTLFRSPIFRLLERHFYFMPNETFKCQAATVGLGASGEGGRGGHDETPCSLMHTCGLVLSPFYILKICANCRLPVSILKMFYHMLLFPTPSVPHLLRLLLLEKTNLSPDSKKLQVTKRWQHG